MTARLTHRRVQANGITFHVAVAGPEDAPAVLCLHGFPEGWMSWRAVMRQLNGLRIYAPDLRGYGETDRPAGGYDILTLTDDVAGLIKALDLNRPVLVGHDWGGALAWIFAHRHSELISRLVVVNCTHPRTLVRAVLRCEDWQTFRIPWVPFFEIPALPERLIATPVGRGLLKLSFTIRQGKPGTMNIGVVDEFVKRFRRPADVRPPISYYRQMVLTQVLPGRREQLNAIYDNPITAPTTLVWGMKDGALSTKVAMQSNKDAGCPVEWRPLPGVGHFVDLEAPGDLANEIARVAGLDPSPQPATVGPVEAFS
jgi:pimeloyl-ACP methyl ester carboxylesterase